VLTAAAADDENSHIARDKWLKNRALLSIAWGGLKLVPVGSDRLADRAGAMPERKVAMLKKGGIFLYDTASVVVDVGTGCA